MFTVLIVLLSLAASLAGALSFGHDRYRTVTTARVETVALQDAGVYRYSLRTLVTAGTAWDFVRLFVGIPVLVASFVIYLRGSLRGTVVFIGSLASFLLLSVPALDVRLGLQRVLLGLCWRLRVEPMHRWDGDCGNGFRHAFARKYRSASRE